MPGMGEDPLERLKRIRTASSLQVAAAESVRIAPEGEETLAATSSKLRP
jgi:hypothetical protein